MLFQSVILLVQWLLHLSAYKEIVMLIHVMYPGNNPALIPVRSSGITLAGTKTSLRIPKKQKEIRKHGKSWSQAVIPGNRTKSVAATLAQQKVVPLKMRSE
jgi:hypothetical protein